MDIKPSELAAVHLDRSDDYECLLDNLRRCRTLESQKNVIKAWEEGVRVKEQRRLKHQVLGAVDTAI